MRRVIWGVVAVLAGCSSSKSGRRTPVEVGWQHVKDAEFDCRPPVLKVTVRADDATAVKVLGALAEQARAGVHELELPADRLAGAETLSVEIDRNGKLERRDVAVPLRRLPSLALSYQHNRPTDAVWTGTLKLTRGAAESSTSWAAALADDGRLAIPLPCGVASGTSPGGTVGVANGVPMLSVDPETALLGESQNQEVPLDATVSVKGGPDGGEATIQLTGKLSTGKVQVARYRAIPTRPLASAPAFEPTKKQPLLLVFPEQVELIGGKSHAEAALIAIATRTQISVDPCGPYEGNIDLPRYRSDLTVAVHDARTGGKRGEKSFQGSVPSCPRTITAFRLNGGNETTSDQVRGDDPAPAVRKWLATAAKSLQ